MAVKKKIGIVLSANNNNTRIVGVDSRIINKRYKKVITKTKRYAVQDSKAASSIGDKVSIRETRPISKTKNWILISVLKQSTT